MLKIIIKQNQKFNTKRDIFFNVSDYFRPWTKQRIWHTIPNNMIPNDIVGFREWLYKPDSCNLANISAADPRDLIRRSCNN